MTAESLQHTPECMNCRFNPRQEQSQYKPSLSQLEDQLEEMLQSWTETLLVNFNDPSVKESIELLESEQKHLMDELIQNRHLRYLLNSI